MIEKIAMVMRIGRRDIFPAPYRSCEAGLQAKPSGKVVLVGESRQFSGLLNRVACPQVVLGAFEDFSGAILSNGKACFGLQSAIEVILLVAEALGNLRDFHLLGSGALEDPVEHSRYWFRARLVAGSRGPGNASELFENRIEEIADG